LLIALLSRVGYRDCVAGREVRNGRRNDRPATMSLNDVEEDSDAYAL
jgi:hypothetical protein